MNQGILFNNQFQGFLEKLGFKKGWSSACHEDEDMHFSKRYGDEYGVGGNIEILQNWYGNAVSVIPHWPSAHFEEDDAFDLDAITPAKVKKTLSKIQKIMGDMADDIVQIAEMARAIHPAKMKYEFTSYSAEWREDGYVEVFGTNVLGNKIRLGVTAKKINDFMSEDVRQKLMQDVIDEFEKKHKSA